jgi:outer membrane protein OmpA-like peptidoglycan-associated protein
VERAATAPVGATPPGGTAEPANSAPAGAYERWDEARYNDALRQQHFDLTRDQLIALAEQEYQRLERDMQAVAQRIDPGTTWQRILERYQATEHPKTTADVIPAYEAQIRRARAFIAEKGLVTFTFPTEVQVLATPAAEIDNYPYAGYLWSDALYVTLDAGAGADEVLRTHGNGLIATAVVHEVYPGHRVQNLTSPGKQVAETFIEGWALYAEELMLRSGYYANGPPELELFAMRMLLYRTARAFLDPKIHRGDLSPDEAMRFLQQNFNLSAERTRIEVVERYLKNPGSAAAYLVGKRQIEQLRRRVETEEGSRFNLKSFHDRLLSRGGLPVQTIARQVFRSELGGIGGKVAAAPDGRLHAADLRVPLCPGLTIVTAVSQPDGDYESIKVIESVDDGEVSVRYSSEVVESAVIRRLTTRRVLRRADLESATLFLHHFHNRAPLFVPDTTALGASAAVMRALKTQGEAQFGLFEPVGASAPADRRTHPNIYDYQIVDRIRRVSDRPVMLPLVVNDASVALPALHARGDYLGDKTDFYFLDDERNPLALKYRIGRDALDVVKIDYDCDPPGTSPAPGHPGGLERALLENGRADVYRIYFSFNSDVIRDESKPALHEISTVLRKHADWTLTVGGHTDSIASDAFNLDLSRRRAEAVKAALVNGYGIAPERLTTAGYGESSPRDANDTLEGRARNRRVELVRIR